MPIIKSLLANLNKRNEVYCNLEDNFAFLVDLKTLTNDQIENSCKKIVSMYPNDINEAEIIDEFQFLKAYLSSDHSDLTYQYVPVAKYYHMFFQIFE